jgi:SM-20-related protein
MTEVIVLRDFLGDVSAEEILAHALLAEHSFQTATVGADEGEVDYGVRRARKLKLPSEMQAWLQAALEKAMLHIACELGLRPFAVASYEIELVSHGDGGFYKRHTDTFTGDERTSNGDRVISCVYYVHAIPKSFSGGELRVYPFPTSKELTPPHIDVVPEHDTLVAFSSWVPHEVLPVSSPSQKFEDSRFSINCWVRQRNDRT